MVDDKTICEQIHDPQRIYNDTMGFQADTPDNCKNYHKRKNALNRAHEIRRFEIELYWKRANYFWILQAAVFTAFGIIVTSAHAQQVPAFLVLALACLGFLCSSAGYLSAEGSKFWQENWEKHIDNLENEFEGKLHKTVWLGEAGIKYSVSRVNSALIICFMFIWAFLAISFYIRFYNNYEFAIFEYTKWDINGIFGNLIFWATIMASLFLANRLKSKLPRELSERVNEKANSAKITSSDHNRWIKRIL